MFDGKTILVTGGTGSFGKRIAATILKRYSPKKLIIFSRDELKQYEMQYSREYEPYDNILRYFIGDVREEARLKRAMEGVDIVFHAAALKQVPAIEYNPFEAVKTNIIGAQNVINAALDAGVSRVIALSTDKAAAPINLYGATKLASDKLFISANNFKGARDIRFSVVRYGNVAGSRGSVIPFFQEKKKEGAIPITDLRMTRFNITVQEGVDFVMMCLKRMWGGELFVPKIPSIRIVDLARAIAPNCKLKVIGIRPGEKIHEEMITETDALNTIEFEKYYVILPVMISSIMKWWDIKEFKEKSAETPGNFCEDGFKYRSNLNTQWLSVEDLRKLVEQL